jgi:hypothetical protein
MSTLKPEWQNVLLKYDEAIREYTEKLRRNRKQLNFNLKYFQYLAVLFTEIFLDKYYNEKEIFLSELNEFLEQFNSENKTQITHFTEENLKKLVAQLKTTGAKLIWAATTPVPEKCSPPRTNDDVIAYNAVAKKIMEANGVAIDDLYAFVLPRMKELQIPNNVHFTPAGYQALAQVAAKSIEAQLAKKP